jgi:ABC-2 type transport system ATP-binding protein
MIQLENICKTFRVAKRKSGFKQAAKALFSRERETVHALSNVSFTVKGGEMVGYIAPTARANRPQSKIMCIILTPDSGAYVIDRLYMFLLLVSLLFVFPAYGLWRIGLRNYKATGS